MDNNEIVTEEVAAVVENNTGIEIEPLFEEYVDFGGMESVLSAGAEKEDASFNGTWNGAECHLYR